MKVDDVSTAREKLSTIKDPFNQRSLAKFSVYCFSGSFSGWSYMGTVGFKNGDTIGEQKFEAEDLHGLLLKMENFIKELK